MQTGNKYAMVVDAMVNDIFGFFNDVCKMKNIFVFSDLMIAENGKSGIWCWKGVSYD